MVAGDFNGDGKLDIVNAGASIMLGNGDGTFQPPLSYGIISGTGLVAGDFNSDLVSDFAEPSSPNNGNATTLSLYVSAPTLNVLPNMLNFGQQTVGTTSTQLPVKLSDIGNSRMSIASVTITGDFQLAQTCTGTIPIGNSCSLQITFTPTVVGNRSGTVTIKNNTMTSPQTIHLTGKGK